MAKPRDPIFYEPLIRKNNEWISTQLSFRKHGEAVLEAKRLLKEWGGTSYKIVKI